MAHTMSPNTQRPDTGHACGEEIAHAWEAIYRRGGRPGAEQNAGRAPEGLPAVPGPGG